MKLRVEEFCSLSTSPPFQLWLKGAHYELYERLKAHLLQGKSCSHNREFMETVVFRIIINNNELYQKLIEFLRKEYPHVVELEEYEKTNNSIDKDMIFDYYNPSIISYPRKLIILGGTNSQKMAEDFVADKPCYELLVINDRAYIEYLNAQDDKLCGQLPNENWKIREFKSKHNFK